MPIRSAARNEPEKRGQRAESMHIVRGVPRVSHFDAVESETDEALEHLSPAIGTRVREDGQAAACMHERDRVGNRQSVFRDVGRPTGPEIAVERIARIPGPSALDQHTRDMRSPDGRVARTRQHLGERDRHAEGVQLVHDLLGARFARLAKRSQCVIQDGRPLNVQTEEMDLAIVIDRAELDAGNDSHAGLLTRNRGLGDTSHRIVIGQRDSGEAGGFRGSNERRRGL